MKNKMTIAIEYEDSEAPLIRQVMENFKSQGKGLMSGDAKVYAVSHGCLFEQIEQIEEALVEYRGKIVDNYYLSQYIEEILK